MKIIYKKEQEVKLGDVIDYYDATITLTQDFIDRNSELFQVEDDIPEYVKALTSFKDTTKGTIYKTFIKHGSYFWYDDKDENDIRSLEEFNRRFKPATKEEYDKQELFLKAKEKYPIGTKFKGLGTGKVFTIASEPYFSGKYICVKTLESPFCAIDIYRSEQWTDILKPIFITSDGVDIYEGDEYWFIHDNKTLSPAWIAMYGFCDWSNPEKPPLGKKQFSTKQLTKQYISDNKPKPVGTYYCGAAIFEQSECYVLMNSKDWDIFKYLGGTTLGLSYKEVFKTKQEAEDYKYNWQPVLTRTDIYNLEQYLPDNYWQPIKGIFNLK